MDLLWLLFICGFVAITIGVGLALNDVSARSSMAKRLAEMSDFHVSHSHISPDGKTGIALDEERKIICLIRSAVWQQIISYRDLLAFDVVQNGVSFTKTSRTSQAATAILGGLMFGGIGAFAGALTGTKVTHEKIKRVDLRLTINDINNPIFVVNFQKTESQSGGLIHSAAMKQVDEWVGRLSVLVRLADNEDRAQERAQLSLGTQMTSVASEIAKLAELRKQGILTDAEFSEQKQRLLALPDVTRG